MEVEPTYKKDFGEWAYGSSDGPQAGQMGGICRQCSPSEWAKKCLAMDEGNTVNLQFANTVTYQEYLPNTVTYQVGSHPNFYYPGQYFITS